MRVALIDGVDADAGCDPSPVFVPEAPLLLLTNSDMLRVATDCGAITGSPAFFEGPGRGRGRRFGRLFPGVAKVLETRVVFQLVPALTVRVLQTGRVTFQVVDL